MAKGSPYQVLDRLRPEEYEALKGDITLHGCLVPVEVDDTGEVLDGHHRVQICEELGIKWKKVVRRFDSDAQKVEHALRLNLLRRHLGPLSWARAFRKLCECRGVRLGQGKRNDRTSVSVSEVAEEYGVDGRTARRRLQMAQRLDAHPDLATKVDTGRMDCRRAFRLAREREIDSECRRTRAPRVLPGKIRIEHCDLRRLEVPDASVDLLFTDPPYTKKYMPVFSDLAEFAARVLKPGRIVVAYCGQWSLPEALDRMREHLTFVWVGAVVFRGKQPNYYLHKIRSRGKPLLFFSKGKYKPCAWIDDMILGGGVDKSRHPWQQSEEEAMYYLQRLSKPGNLVVDPFLGSGTTAVAAARLGRRFVGCDVEGKWVRVAKRRVSQVAPTPTADQQPRVQRTPLLMTP